MTVQALPYRIASGKLSCPYACLPEQYSARLVQVAGLPIVTASFGG